MISHARTFPKKSEKYKFEGKHRHLTDDMINVTYQICKNNNNKAKTRPV